LLGSGLPRPGSSRLGSRGVTDIGSYLWAGSRLEASITHDEGATGISSLS